MSKTPYTTVVPEKLEDINFLSHDLQNCPYHAYSLLRDEAPVWIDPITGFYVITRFDDLREGQRVSYDVGLGPKGPRAGARAPAPRIW